MKKSIISFVIFFFLLSLTACTTKMTKNDFLIRINQHSIETINHVFYTGSMKGYDYFYHGTTSSSTRIRIKEGEFILATRFNLTNDKKKWVLVKRNSDLFLQNNPLQSISNISGIHIHIQE